MAQRRIIWFAIVFSTIIYFAMIFAITRDKVHPSFDAALNASPLVIPLYGIALVMFLITMFVVPRFRFANAQQAMIVKLAMYEACAVFGLIAAFIAHDWRLYLAPWALALMGFMREWPTES